MRKGGFRDSTYDFGIEGGQKAEEPPVVHIEKVLDESLVSFPSPGDLWPW